MPTRPEFIGSSELPWDVGSYRGPDAHDAGSGYDTETWTLTGLAQEYWLFTPYVLSAAGLPFDPVHLCWEENRFPVSEAPYAVESRVPLLSGPEPPFDRTLFACPLPFAKQVQAFLDRMVIRSGAAVYEAVHQRVDLVDWVMLDRLSVGPSTPPVVKVSLYGLIGPVGFIWSPPADPWSDRFRLVQRTPKPTRKVPPK